MVTAFGMVICFLLKFAPKNGLESLDGYADDAGWSSDYIQFKVDQYRRPNIEIVCNSFLSPSGTDASRHPFRNGTFILGVRPENAD